MRATKKLINMAREQMELKKSKFGIFIRMMVFLLLPIFIGLLTMGFIILMQVKKETGELVDSNLSANTETEAVRLSEYFTRYTETARQLAANSMVRQELADVHMGTLLTDRESFGEMQKVLLDSAATDTGNILATWYADIDSSQVTKSDKLLTDSGFKVEERPWIAAAKNNAVFITEPYEDVTTAKLIVTIAAPVRAPGSSTEVVGISGVNILLTTIEEMMASFKVGREGFATLLTADGIVLYHRDSAAINKKVEELDFSDNFKEAVRSIKMENMRYQYQGKEYYGSLKAIGTTGWTVAAALPGEEYMEALNALMKTICIAFGICAGVLMLLILLVSRNIILPIKRLSETSEKIANGEFDVSLEKRKGDEVGLLIYSFGKTISRIREYSNYIDEISGVLNDIADGNLVYQLKNQYIGEFGKIKDALMRIQMTLTGTIAEIGDSSGLVYREARQLEEASGLLAQGATDQASSLDDLTKTVVDIKGQVETNVSNAENASIKVRETERDISESNEQMKELMQAIGNIEESSGKIGKIIKTIEDIAFQTNILALNASVEAARAGEAGKGFAVVAGEVRMLANKSAEAAKDSAALIEESIAAVGEGMGIARNAAVSLDEVVGSAKEVTGYVIKIMEACEQQRTSIGRVNNNVERISGVVRNNTAAAQESASSSEELTTQAEQLKELIRRFHIEG